MQASELLLTRQSYNKLVEPAPTHSELELILNSAMAVPDHGSLMPWQFIVFQEKARNDLGEIFAEAAEIDKADEVKIHKAVNMPLRAPLIIAVIAKIKPDCKIPAQEQLITAGCCVHSMQMMAVSLGYQGIWRSGEYAYHPHVHKQLKLESQDEIVGFLYLGSAKDSIEPKQRQSYQTHTIFW